MISDRRPMWLLLLLVLGASAQDDDGGAAPADGGDAQTADDTEPAGEKDCECEEAWAYVEFLKKEVNEKVTKMLTEDFKNPSDNIVADTMKQVIDIRKILLDRIKAIRKEEEKICEFQDIEQESKLTNFRMEVMEILLLMVEANAEENLKEISNKLLDFRRTINTEIMRLLMLPQPDCDDEPKPPKPEGDCEPFQSIHKELKGIQICASKSDEDEDKDDAGGEDSGDDGGDDAAGDDSGDEGEPGEKCDTPPSMYPMTLITQNELLDDAIEELYTQIIKETDEDKRTDLFAMLTMMKGLREEIDEVITKLLPLDNDEAIKKEVSKIGGLVRKLEGKLSACGSCSSCAKEILEEAIQKMADYLESFESDRDDSSKLEFVRSDMISYINKNTEKARKLLEKKINDGDLDKCDREQLDVYNKCKPPMWMLVNYTIFQELPEVTEMVTTMEDQLKKKLEMACDPGTPTTPPPSTGSGCEWEEYEHTKEVLELVDETIQNSIFKGKDKGQVLLGFLQIQEMFDNRVKKLFEDGVKCREELTKIKTIYMPQLGDCMTDFMDPKLDFENLKRQERILCIKGLRSTMEGRNTNLLQFELETSLSGLDGSGRKGRRLGLWEK